MRRTARYAFTALSALSLLLCVGVCLLWVSSYWVAQSWRWDAPRSLYAVVSTRGHVACACVTWTWAAFDGYFSRAPGYHVEPAFTPAPHGLQPTRSFAGFHRWDETSSQVPDVRARALSVPDWSLVLAFSPLPLLWVMSARRRSLRATRLRSGLCPACGYDLRATPECCPECGRAVTTPSTGAV